jgi:hypothetical protein
MVELLRTNDLVLISALEAFLTSAGIGYFVADRHMSATEGSLGFLPVRLMVDAGRAAQARELVKGAGFEVTFTDG